MIKLSKMNSNRSNHSKNRRKSWSSKKHSNLNDKDEQLENINVQNNKKILELAISLDPDANAIKTTNNTSNANASPNVVPNHSPQNSFEISVSNLDQDVDADANAACHDSNQIEGMPHNHANETQRPQKSTKSRKQNMRRHQTLSVSIASQNSKNVKHRSKHNIDDNKNNSIGYYNQGDQSPRSRSDRSGQNESENDVNANDDADDDVNNGGIIDPDAETDSEELYSGKVIDDAITSGTPV